MKAILTFFAFLFPFITLSAQELPFRAERMITDFSGVVSNGKNVLCYGDYGIITYSIDLCKTFKQLNIGDKYNIKGIKTIGDDFIGFTDNALIKSTTNGLTWEVKEQFGVSRIIDLVVHNNTPYLLTPSGIYTSDINLKLSPEPILQLDSTKEYNGLQTDGTDTYFIYSKKFLIHYSTVTNSFDTTDVIKVTEPSCGNCQNISNLKLQGNTLYLMINAPYNGLVVDSTQKILKYDIKGKTWKTMIQSVHDGCYSIINNDLCFYETRQATPSKESLLATEFFKIDTSKQIWNSKEASIINYKDTIADRMIYYSGSYPFKFTGMTSVTADVLIAVGINKAISVSYNGGITWEVKSFLYTFYEGDDNVTFPSKDLGYIVGSTQYFRTLDGGITWLPQKFSYFSKLRNSAPNRYYFNSTGQGYLKNITIDSSDTNIIVTNNYGDNYTFLYSDSLSHYTYENNSHFNYQFRKALDCGDYILNLGYFGKSNFNILLRYDKNFHLIDTSHIMAKNILAMNVTKDMNIFCLCYNYSGENNPDSIGKTKDYTYSYYILKSTDQGKTWDSLPIAVPIYQTLDKNYLGNYFYNNIMNFGYKHYGFMYGNYIFYPSDSPSNNKSGYNLLYRYDYVNSVFDSVKIPTQINFNKNTLFHFDSKFYVVSNSNNLFLTKDIGAKVPVWDSLRCDSIFFNWDGFNSYIPFDRQDAILSSHIFDDTSGILAIGKSSNGTFGKKFKFNFAKLSRNSSVNSVQEPKPGVGSVSLKNFEPYPLPGSTVIQSQIVWNQQLSIEDATIKVFDAAGREIKSNSIRINKIKDTEGILEWDCTGVLSGVYTLQISLGGESISIPVVVRK